MISRTALIGIVGTAVLAAAAGSVEAAAIS
jgi:hypothetical protein